MKTVGLVFIAMLLIAGMILPFPLIRAYRASVKKLPRIHPILDMDKQPKFRSQDYHPGFADERSMRPRVPGTVARGDLELTEAERTGIVDQAWVGSVSEVMIVNDDLLHRGQKQYEIYCRPCHGSGGLGDGPVSKRALQLKEPNWVPPASLVSNEVKSREAGHVFNTISRGIRSMPAYGAQIDIPDRWAIVAFIGTLNGTPDSVSVMENPN